MRKAGTIALLAVFAGAAGGCGSTGAVPRPFPRPSDAAPRMPVLTPDNLPPGPAGALVEMALSLRGIPYRDGGADPSGFDCSGLVSYVFARQGRAVPRTAAEQFTLGAAVPREAIAAGDLVFFSTIAPGPSHVGIALSREEFVHAPTSSGVVRVESLNAPYWSERFVGARRPD